MPPKRQRSYTAEIDSKDSDKILIDAAEKFIIDSTGAAAPFLKTRDIAEAMFESMPSEHKERIKDNLGLFMTQRSGTSDESIELSRKLQEKKLLKTHLVFWCMERDFKKLDNTFENLLNWIGDWHRAVDEDDANPADFAQSESSSSSSSSSEDSSSSEGKDENGH